VLNDVSLFGEFDTNDASLKEEEREVFGEVVRGNKEEELIVE
jgi:predicted aconitase with swiveling domain